MSDTLTRTAQPMSDDWKSNLKELYQREQKLAEDREGR
jgi:hypothetical protein